MRRIHTLALAALLVASLPLFAAPETWTSDKTHSEATFQIRHMMAKVSGRFDTLNAVVVIDREKPAASSVDFTIQAASINTGAEGRDKHLRTEDFFDVEKNPTITFKSTSIAPTKTKDLYNVTGDFTMRGVTKRITVPVEFLGFGKDARGNEKSGFSITTTLNRKDYGINWNRAVDNGFLLSDEVTINVNLEMNKEKPPAPAAAPAATSSSK